MTWDTDVRLKSYGYSGGAVFPLTENIVLWAVMALVGLVSWAIMRRYVRRQMLTAPKESLRNPAQRRLHWISLFMTVLPLLYVFLVDGSLFWATLVVLWAHAGLMMLLRLARFRFALRIWLIAPVTVISVIVGAIVSTWPEVDFASIKQAPWPFLSAAGCAFAISYLLGMWSFPIGYGERAF